jgi:hypothetical protein
MTLNQWKIVTIQGGKDDGVANACKRWAMNVRDEMQAVALSENCLKRRTSDCCTMFISSKNIRSGRGWAAAGCRRRGRRRRRRKRDVSFAIQMIVRDVSFGNV